MAVLTIAEALCKSCMLCINACPRKILAQDKTHVNAKGYSPVVCTDVAQCSACAICAKVCPDSVIKVERCDGS